MKQPQINELATLMATVEAMRDAEARLVELKAQAVKDAHGLAAVSDKHQRLAAATYAYWYAPEVNAKDLAFGATGRHHASALLKVMGPVSMSVPCDRCQGDLPIHSRNEMNDVLGWLKSSQPRYPEGYRILCEPCWGEVQDERASESNAQERALAKRATWLQAQPYPTYLQTEDWVQRQWEFLWGYLYEAAEFQCETCESADQLGTYHSSLEDLGRSDHLVLLCRHCVSALRAADKIVGVPGPGNLMSPDLAEQVRASIGSERFATHD